MSETGRLQVGFIPLTDAATVLVAVDKGFAADEGLEVSLVREVSWSNVRDKLNVGLFDAASLLAPVAIASSLGAGHIRVPIVAPMVLGLDGNAITVSADLHRRLASEAGGTARGPLATAQELARVVGQRRGAGQEPLTFGITFPFSTHNYLLRYWMAAGGIDPDEDIRLVVLPPSLMVESLANGQVDGFCVGEPWNSVAVQFGVGRILHFSTQVLANCTEKVLAVREGWAARNTSTLSALIRTLQRAASFIEQPGNLAEVATILSRPDRVGVAPDLMIRTLQGRRVPAKDGGALADDPPQLTTIGRTAMRPDPMQAAWLYAQMVRWGQTALSREKAAQASRVFRPDLFDAAVASDARRDESAKPIVAFDGLDFDPADIETYLARLAAKRH